MMMTECLDIRVRLSTIVISVLSCSFGTCMRLITGRLRGVCGTWWVERAVVVIDFLIRLGQR